MAGELRFLYVPAGLAILCVSLLTCCLLFSIFLHAPRSWRGKTYPGIIQAHLPSDFELGLTYAVQEIREEEEVGVFIPAAPCLSAASPSPYLWLQQLLGEGNGTPLQYSCLENPMDGGAWWAAISGVAQSPTQLKRLSSQQLSGGFPPRVTAPVQLHPLLL